MSCTDDSGRDSISDVTDDDDILRRYAITMSDVNSAQQAPIIQDKKHVNFEQPLVDDPFPEFIMSSSPRSRAATSTIRSVTSPSKPSQLPPQDPASPQFTTAPEATTSPPGRSESLTTQSNSSPWQPDSSPLESHHLRDQLVVPQPSYPHHGFQAIQQPAGRGALSQTFARPTPTRPVCTESDVNNYRISPNKSPPQLVEYRNSPTKRTPQKQPPAVLPKPKCSPNVFSSSSSSSETLTPTTPTKPNESHHNRYNLNRAFVDEAKSERSTRSSHVKTRLNDANSFTPLQKPHVLSVSFADDCSPTRRDNNKLTDECSTKKNHDSSDVNRLTSPGSSTSGHSSASGLSTEHDPVVVTRCARLANESSRLHHVLSAMPPEQLQDILLSKLRSRDSRQIVSLAVLLPHTQFPSGVSGHCLRCHKEFNPNMPSSCVLQHPNHCVEMLSQDNSGGNFHCSACASNFQLPGMFYYDQSVNSYMSGYCYKGDHVTRVDDVDYSTGAVRTCSDVGCVEFFV